MNNKEIVSFIIIQGLKRMKNLLLYLAMFLLVLCLPIYGNEKEVNWLWSDMIWVPISLIISSIILIGIYLYKLENPTLQKVETQL